jgi:hypothetical protein
MTIGTKIRLRFEIRIFSLFEYSKFGKSYRIRIEPEPYCRRKCERKVRTYILLFLFFTILTVNYVKNIKISFTENLKTLFRFKFVSFLFARKIADMILLLDSLIHLFRSHNYCTLYVSVACSISPPLPLFAWAQFVKKTTWQNTTTSQSKLTNPIKIPVVHLLKRILMLSILEI